MVKVASWNLCLGLINKKDHVLSTLKHEEIDICLAQEVEIKKDYDLQLLSDLTYKIEVEVATCKSRNATFIKNGINYERRLDLEGINNHLVIIDVNMIKSYRIINIYITFNPPNNETQLEHFKRQLEMIRNAITTLDQRSIIIGGDFNIDYSRIDDLNYRNKLLCEKLSLWAESESLIQIIEFPTWHRVVNDVYIESTLDHFYVRDPTLVAEIINKRPLIGDHQLIILDLPSKPIEPKTILKRCWKNYNKQKLLLELAALDFSQEPNDPQNYWNMLETKLLPVIDKLAPKVAFVNNVTTKSIQPNKFIKNKLNLRKRLIKNLKTNASNKLRDRVKNLNTEIKHHFSQLKINSIKRHIIPGNSKSLWNAVRQSKNLDIPRLPEKMYYQDQIINNNELPDKFAEFFTGKINDIVNNSLINPNVYNGNRKFTIPDKDFMQPEKVVEAVNSLKIKNCEGHDSIPQRIIKDGIEILKFPLSKLFNKIYINKEIPEQWLIAKIIPLHKKGAHNNIQNYRPISNLCSVSKVYEKLILQRIHSIEKQYKIDLTGKSQYGFKAKHSTSLAGQKLQSLITQSLEKGHYALMSSIDLSAAFDVVNVDLLLKRLRIIGLPGDLIELIRIWLDQRYYYVTIENDNSYVHTCTVGTVQGSILGPILYALFVAPLLDLVKLTLFADDNYIIASNDDLTALINDMKFTLEMITKWLRDSGLKVNDEKTEACLFHIRGQAQIEFEINGIIVKTKPSMNVLGVQFDSKLQWHEHIQNVRRKLKKVLQSLFLIRKYFNKSEFLTIVTSNYYSILYYNAEIWLLPTLSPNMKAQLLAASAAPLKLVNSNYDRRLSYNRLHEQCNRATPDQVTKYRHSLLLHRVYNDQTQGSDWVSINFNQNFNVRLHTIFFVKTNHYRVGNNLITNRLNILNGLVTFDMLNQSLESFKLRMKEIFLSFI